MVRRRELDPAGESGFLRRRQKRDRNGQKPGVIESDLFASSERFIILYFFLGIPADGGRPPSFERIGRLAGNSKIFGYLNPHSRTVAKMSIF